ncbi:MAG: hypothetical protein HKO93_00665, partial [Flavobacteriales bacterium]|nr:hypothetical protein [Flavobacteriales bacterium]
MYDELNDNPEGRIPLTHIRPRFKVVADISAEELCERLKEGLRKHNSQVVGEAHKRYANIKIPKYDLHYWSPQLTLTMEESEDKVIVRGLFGPRPAVWTMIMFFYAFIGFAITVIGVIGMSQITMED